MLFYKCILLKSLSCYYFVSVGLELNRFRPVGRICNVEVRKSALGAIGVARAGGASISCFSKAVDK